MSRARAVTGVHSVDGGREEGKAQASLLLTHRPTFSQSWSPQVSCSLRASPSDQVTKRGSLAQLWRVLPTRHSPNYAAAAV
ncbi:hypothetical protein ACOMHN_062333 [Nucella lapillus]